jgi:hypothetical protein
VVRGQSTRMLKIALIYTGQLRTWELCRHNHAENIYTKDCSMYWHTYEEPDVKTVMSSDNLEKYSIDGFRWHFVKVPEPFYPDPFKEHKYAARKRPETSVYQTLGQWHTNFIGFCLVPRGYDVYVRIRPDIKFNGRLDFTQYDYTGNNIYIPEGNDYGGVNDQFAFGNYDVMKAYYSVYLNCHQLWEDGVEFHSEGMQQSNLNRQQINIVRMNPQVNILR